ncbi:MAG: TetR/AcrR family transcriptional regulator [Polyangiaceae bacterium]|nr:TetR/AcrR family transcriptional regulator [Polyangiaceae bacterium]MCB9605745.1 TetR/AcrR family transcriptional regulator [Polyangiaceae bacterium]
MISSASNLGEAERTAEELSSVSRPKQARSQRTLERLLDAAEQLILEQGLVEVSIPEIVARAGSSVGGFYGRFKDKDALMRALEERFLARVGSLLEEVTRPERWEDKSLEQTIAGLLEVMVQVYSDAGPLLRAFVAHAARSQKVWRDGRRLRGQATRHFIELGLRHADQITHPEPAKALELGLQMVFGVLQQKAILGDVRVQQRALSNAELVEEFTSVILAYLRVHR